MKNMSGLPAFMGNVRSRSRMTLSPFSKVLGIWLFCNRLIVGYQGQNTKNISCRQENDSDASDVGYFEIHLSSQMVDACGLQSTAQFFCILF